MVSADRWSLYRGALHVELNLQDVIQRITVYLETCLKTTCIEDHLSIETTVGHSMGHLSDTNTLYKDQLSTETIITWSLEWLF